MAPATAQAVTIVYSFLAAYAFLPVNIFAISLSHGLGAAIDLSQKPMVFEGAALTDPKNIERACVAIDEQREMPE